jgi:hypothetical protein
MSGVAQSGSPNIGRKYDFIFKEILFIFFTWIVPKKHTTHFGIARFAIPVDLFLSFLAKPRPSAGSVPASFQVCYQG